MNPLIILGMMLLSLLIHNITLFMMVALILFLGTYDLPPLFYFGLGAAARGIDSILAEKIFDSLEEKGWPWPPQAP